MERKWEQGKLGFLDYEDPDPRKARMCMLSSGHTEAALGFGTYQKMEIFTFVSQENPYFLDPDFYTRKGLFKYIAENYPPDISEGTDPLRDYVLEEIRRFQELKEILRVHASNISPEVWSFDVYTGQVRFPLEPNHPRNQKDKLEIGFYTVDEMIMLLKRDPKCPIFSNNHKKRELMKGSQVKRYHRDGLERLAKNIDEGFNERLLRMALMVCRYPDLVEEYRGYLPRRSQY